MNDDLVRKLRLIGTRASYRPLMYHTAADRIEALTARAEAAEAREARLRAACEPLGPAMYFMDDRASDEDVCIISAKTVKDIRAALKGEQK